MLSFSLVLHRRERGHTGKGAQRRPDLSLWEKPVQPEMTHPVERMNKAERR